MIRITIITFGFLSAAWYELSGGAEFNAGDTGVPMLASYVPAAEAVETKPLVARGDINPALNELVPPAPAPRVQAALMPAMSAPVMVEPRVAPAKVETAKLEQALFEDSETIAPVAQPTVARATSIDYRVVTGSLVNLRTGPSTSYDVVTQLLEDERVEVMDETGDGWVKLRAVDGNETGWMSDDFLARLN